MEIVILILLVLVLLGVWLLDETAGSEPAAIKRIRGDSRPVV
ncbi:hypothetical protein [Streptococcus sp.]